MFVSLAVLVLLAASAQANLQDLSHGFPCKEVTNPRDEYKVCSYNGQNETMFHMLRSGDASNGPFVGTGLNGTDNFVVAWRSTHGKGMLKLIDGTGAIVKDMVLSEDAGDSMPAVAPLSGQGFAVAITTCQGDVKTATYDNNGTVIMDWQLLNLNDIVAAPTVTGISEDRFVVLAKDNLNQLWASVWYKTERISAFKATADAESYRAVALSGDSYVIMTKSSANDVYLLAFRALSQEKYTLENIEANGVIARGADGVALSALVDNHFTAVVTRTPEIKLYTYHFKDAKLLRAGNNQQDVRITTPQAISGVVHVTDAATPARVAFRENGFVVTYGDTSQRFKAVVFQRQGVANGTVVTVHKGPVTDAGGFAVGAGTQGFAASHANTDGSAGVAFFAPADFGELVRADDESSDGDRKRANAKRQATTVADASATAASESTSTAADASTTAAPATTTTTTTTVAATTTTTTAAATTTTAATTDDAADPTTTTTTSAAAATTTTMTMVAEDESFAGAVEAPLLFATSTGNVVALWLSDEPQADADAIVGFNAHVTLYSADGETIATSQLVDDGSVAKVDELLVDSDCSGAAALAAQLLAALVALLAALL